MKKRVKDFGLADAYVLACALKYKVKVLTGTRISKEFQKLL
ncbi:MAG: hypothetical protein ACP5JW_02100 [Candidatus Bathyarchaeia archaeon]